MIRTYTLNGLPPTMNDRLKPGLTQGAAIPGTTIRGKRKPSLYTSEVVKRWKADVTLWMLAQRPELHPESPLAVGLVFRFGDNRKDVDSGIKDVLDAVQSRKGIVGWDDRGALYRNDRQVVALFAVKDARKGPVGVDLFVGTLAEVAEVARAVVACAEDIGGVRR